MAKAMKAMEAMKAMKALKKMAVMKRCAMKAARDEAPMKGIKAESQLV